MVTATSCQHMVLWVQEQWQVVPNTSPLALEDTILERDENVTSLADNSNVLLTGDVRLIADLLSYRLLQPISMSRIRFISFTYIKEKGGLN